MAPPVAPAGEPRAAGLFTLPPEYWDGVTLASDAGAAGTPAPQPEQGAAPARAPATPAADSAASAAPADGGRPICTACGASFAAVTEQRAHFRTDWHRLNAKRRLAGRAALSEEEMERLLADGGDGLSSISGGSSDAEEEDEEEDEGGPGASGRRGAGGAGLSGRGGVPPQLLLCCPRSGRVFPLWRCLLEPEGAPAADPLAAARSLGRGPGRWLVVLSLGGHFAAACFDGRGAPPGSTRPPAAGGLAVVAHTTFHRYVIRAKAGGRQSAHDKSAGNAKSAGAALRRHNEASLERDIHELLSVTWAHHVAAAELILVAAPGASGLALFAGDAAPLSRKDPRVRRVPFTTRRPTFKEACRVAQQLSRVEYRPLGGGPALPEGEGEAAEAGGAVAGGAKGARAAPGGAGATAGPSGEDAGAGGADGADAAADEDEEEDDDDGVTAWAAAFGGSGLRGASTPLHLAARAGQADVIRDLLAGGADPTAVDERGRPPYLVAKDRPARDAFRRQMAATPEAWDWRAAGVPSGLTAAMEAAQAARAAEKDARRKAKERERKKAAAARKKAAAAEAAAAAAAAPPAPAPAEPAAPAGRAQAGRNAGRDKDRELRAAAAEKRLQALGLGGIRPA